MEKSTHAGYRTELFMPIMKEASGKYIAVLSDNSVDRDEEKVSKACIEKLGIDDGYLAALCNHKNDVFMQVAEWTNKGCREVDGNTALVAEPKFFLSNPNAKIIKGMLDEGAKLGISIGAIVKDYDEVNGMRVYTDLELVEASFVAIPSNRHGRAMAVAKSFNRKSEVINMEKEFTQKDIDLAVEKSSAELNKQISEKDIKIEELSKSLKKAEEEKVDSDKATEEAEVEAEKKYKALELELEKVKKTALDKQQHANEGGEDNSGEADVDVEKELKAGKIPVMYM